MQRYTFVDQSLMSLEDLHSTRVWLMTENKPYTLTDHGCGHFLPSSKFNFITRLSGMRMISSNDRC